VLSRQLGNQWPVLGLGVVFLQISLVWWLEPEITLQ
jgi:hypothetical protein